MRSSSRFFAGLLAILALSVVASAQRPAQPIYADKIVVVKSTHTMTLYAAGKVLKVYPVSLGPSPKDAKQRRGDHHTPEGNYVIDSKNANSHYHLALHVSYPNAEDRARAKKLGVDPGGDIMVHGLPPEWAWLSHAQEIGDWTDGCIALTNAEMDEVWKLVPAGTPIEIRH
jgi:murein L,D-transpeptidase YafK